MRPRASPPNPNSPSATAPAYAAHCAGPSPAPACAGSRSASRASGGSTPAHQEVATQPAAPHAPASTPAAPGSTRAGRSTRSGSTCGTGRGAAATARRRRGCSPVSCLRLTTAGLSATVAGSGSSRNSRWTGISVVASFWMSRVGRAGPSAGPSGSDVWEVVVLMRASSLRARCVTDGSRCRVRDPPEGPDRGSGPVGRAYEKSRRQVSGPG